jgi:hypothetical protein
MGGGEMKPHRVQLSRKKGWRMPPNTEYVARPTQWGNPNKVCDTTTANQAVDLYRDQLALSKLRDPAFFAEWIAPLKGKNLACWCKLGEPCHADVLLDLANGTKAQEDDLVMELAVPVVPAEDDPNYQKFVEEMAQHCHCTEQNRPCDGVLAGGPCDNVQPIAPPEKEGDL